VKLEIYEEKKAINPLISKEKIKKQNCQISCPDRFSWE